MPKANWAMGRVVSLRTMASNGRPRPQSRAIVLEAVANGATVKDAAERAGCGERTAWRWSTEPAFKSELAEIQRARREQAENILAAEIEASLATIRMIRDDVEQDGGTRLRASVELLDRVGVVKTDRAEVHLHQHAEDVSDEDIDQELLRIQAQRDKDKDKGTGDEEGPH